MLLRRDVLEGIRDGRITLQFRRWQRPTVKTGGTLLTVLGQLGIEKVLPVELDDITPAQAREAGFDSLEAMRSELNARSGQLYRIELGALGADPRIALRESPPSEQELEQIRAKLARLDAHAESPWTGKVLRLIERRPAVRAGDLAAQLSMERLPFKANVRKLKALGLTISLEVGYELSARGRAVLGAADPSSAG